MFIRATAMERREMIEEILGLREFQLKRADAERRLKNAQINLEKVRALTEEILPHLRSLKRQTGRWERRGALEEELRSLENEFFGGQWNGLSERLSAVEFEEKERLKHFAQLREEKDKAEKRTKEIELGEPKEREEMRAVKIETQKLLERRSEMQKELGRLEAHLEFERSSSTPASAVTAEKLLKLANKIRTILSDAIMRGGELRETIEKVITDIDVVLKGEKNTPEPKDGKRVKIEADFKILSDTLRKLEINVSDLKDKEKALEKNQEQFYGLFKEAMGELKAAQDKIDQWEREGRDISLRRERLTVRREELERQISQAGRKPSEFANMKSAALTDSESSALDHKIFKLRGELASMGEADPLVMKEAQETETRYEFLQRESGDLEAAREDLKKLIKELGLKIKTEFDRAFHKINDEFHKFFELMFGGGQAKLKLAKREPKNIAVGEEGESEESAEPAEAEDEEIEEGIDIQVALPRKRINSLEMLSGGERSLVGIAALFALISVSPPPFLVLDEIDAALDERNARRFAEMLKEFSKQTQFIVVTHNRSTMEAANILYGVTLNDDGTSKILSVKLAA
jgi:chromosome segregation protein